MHEPTWAWNPRIIRSRIEKLTHQLETTKQPWSVKARIKFWQDRLPEAEKREAERLANLASNLS